jgi:serine/threonine-protein kinase
LSRFPTGDGAKGTPLGPIGEVPAAAFVLGGRYEIERELGRGGMGRVLLARDNRLGRRVAVKMLPAGVHTESALHRFELEARAAGSLNHPNILDVHDIGVWEGEPYIVSELLEGETLSDRLRRGTLSPQEAIGYAVQLGDGLAAAHDKGIIHRDLKPENLFLSRNGRLKILDFGIAKLVAHAPEQVDELPASRPRTETGAILGTIGYMSPEQIRGEAVDERSDIFSCGMIFYEMVAGRAAFGRQTTIETGYAILNDDLPDLPDEVPAPFAEMVQRCSEKKPADRFQSAHALLLHLKDLASVPSRGQTAGDHPAKARRALSRRSPRRSRALAGVLAAIACAAAAYLLYRFGPRINAPEVIPSIAILPFADLSPGKDVEYFSDGLADEILDALVNIKGLRVAGRTSSFSFKGKSDDVQSIARKLHVVAVLEGSVRKDGNWLRISAQLIDAVNGFHVWSKSFDRAPTGIFAVQEEISYAVVQALREHFHLEAHAAPALAPKTTDEAHARYLIARQLLNRGSADGYRRAMEAFEKTVKLDPSYAPAWVGLASAAYYWSNLTEGPAEVERVRRRALAAADKAISLAPNLSEAWAARSYLRGLAEWDWEGAQKDLDTALRLNSGDAQVLRRLGVMLASLGRLPEALVAVRKSADLDPLATEAWDNLAYLANATGDYATARSASARALEIAPEQRYAATHGAVADLLEGNPARALAAFESSADEIFRLEGLAMAQHDLGHEPESQRALQALIGKYGDNSAFQIAQAHAWRGDRDRAFEWLERGYRDHDGGVGYVKVDPLLRKIRDDARYSALLRKMKLPQ